MRIYFEKIEGMEIPRCKIHPKMDKILREFILNGGVEENSYCSEQDEFDMVAENIKY
jgi:hypothetical protein